MTIYLQKLEEFNKRQTPVVSVILVDAPESTQENPGNKILVTKAGLVFGTIGAGPIENRAIETAQALLSLENANQSTHFLEWDLQKDFGMIAVGVVKLYFETFNLLPWNIVVFGAGHLANALIPLLLNLDCQVTCLDTRQEWLAKLPQSPKLSLVHAENLTEEVAAVSANAFVLLITKGHGTDRPILKKFLERAPQPYLGVIGSKSKAAVLRQELKKHGLSEEKCQAYICPLGLPIGSNHPYEIAISIAAQLIEERDRVFKCRQSSQ